MNLEKLARIEEQHATMADGVRAIFARYRTRAEGARDKCQLAVACAHDERIQCKPLAALAEYTHEQLKRYGVDLELLESARRDEQIASTLFADFEKRKREADESGSLLRSLQQHANTHEGNAVWSHAK